MEGNPSWLNFGLALWVLFLLLLGEWNIKPLHHWAALSFLINGKKILAIAFKCSHSKYGASEESCILSMNETLQPLDCLRFIYRRRFLDLTPLRQAYAIGRINWLICWQGVEALLARLASCRSLASVTNTGFQKRIHVLQHCLCTYPDITALSERYVFRNQVSKNR